MPPTIVVDPRARRNTNNPLTNQYNLYNSAVGQQAGDYDSIMEAYRKILGSNQANGGFKSSYVPQASQYFKSPDVTSAISNLGELSRTGGYSDAGIADVRARGISPIRSIYAGANRDIDRQRAVQGGFSPNYGALKAKMAREMSEQIGGAVTNVNAQIAQSVAGNRLQAAPSFASAAGQESAAANEYEMALKRAADEGEMFNIQQAQQQKDRAAQQQLQAVGGMQSLYGTTPAMSSLFGNQAQNAAQLQNQITQQNSQNFGYPRRRNG